MNPLLKKIFSLIGLLFFALACGGGGGGGGDSSQNSSSTSNTKTVTGLIDHSVLSQQKASSNEFEIWALENSLPIQEGSIAVASTDSDDSTFIIPNLEIGKEYVIQLQRVSGNDKVTLLETVITPSESTTVLNKVNTERQMNVVTTYIARRYAIEKVQGKSLEQVLQSVFGNSVNELDDVLMVNGILRHQNSGDVEFVEDNTFSAILEINDTMIAVANMSQSLLATQKQTIESFLNSASAPNLNQDLIESMTRLSNLIAQSIEELQDVIDQAQNVVESTEQQNNSSESGSGSDGPESPEPAEPIAGSDTSEVDTSAPGYYPPEAVLTPKKPSVSSFSGNVKEGIRTGIPRFVKWDLAISDFSPDGRWMIQQNDLRYENDPRITEGIVPFDSTIDPLRPVDQPDQQGGVIAWTVHMIRPELMEKNRHGFLDISNASNNIHYFSNSGNTEGFAVLEASQMISSANSTTPGWMPPSGIVNKAAPISISMDENFTVNPYRSDDEGNMNANGQYETYRCFIYHDWSPARVELGIDGGGPLDRHIGVIPMELVVKKPRTTEASVQSCRLIGQYQPLLSPSGNLFAAGEITATGDGRLICYHGDTEGERAIEGSIQYIWNATPGSNVGWSEERNLGEMYEAEGNTIIGEHKFHEIYPLARQPLKDSKGIAYSKTRPLQGAYPWLTRNGTDITFSLNGASFASVLGQFTGYHIRHMDGPINPTRFSDPANGHWPRNQIHSPGGMTGTRWAPFTDLDKPTIPSIKRKYVMPLVGSGTNYHEVSFDEFIDGDYITFLSCNELLNGVELGPKFTGDKAQRLNYEPQTDATQDISSLFTLDLSDNVYRRVNNLNHGQLFNGAAFPQEAALANASKVSYALEELYEQEHKDEGILLWSKGAKKPSGFGGGDAEPENYDRMVGMMGQGIMLPSAGSIVVPYNHTFDTITNQMTLEIFFKFIDHNALGLNIAKRDNFTLNLNTIGHVEASVTLADSTELSLVSKDALKFNTWYHLALVFDNSNGDSELTLYIDACQSAKTSTTPMPLLVDSSDLLIGPNLSGASKSDYVAVVDEIALSRVARTLYEIESYAYVEKPQEDLIPLSHKDSSKLNDSVPLGLSKNEILVPKNNSFPDTSFDEVVDLGKLLFNDQGLSSNGAVSCATCHIEDKAFTDGVQYGVGVSGNLLPLNSPTLINRAMGTYQFWDGRSGNLENQPKFAISHPDEMGFSMSETVERAQKSDHYKLGGVNRFESIWGEKATQSHVETAIATYVRTLLAGNSKVDQFENGDGLALNEYAIRGRGLFYGKANCVACHHGTNYSDELFHATNISKTQALGRYDFNKRTKDRLAVKTATLRDVESTAPFRHNGNLADLETLVEAYNKGGEVINGREPSVRMFPLNLDGDEVNDLVEFLKALTSNP